MNETQTAVTTMRLSERRTKTGIVFNEFQNSAFPSWLNFNVSIVYWYLWRKRKLINILSKGAFSPKLETCFMVVSSNLLSYSDRMVTLGNIGLWFHIGISIPVLVFDGIRGLELSLATASHAGLVAAATSSSVVLRRKWFQCNCFSCEVATTHQ